MAVSTRALKPASEKRQGTKSREVKHQWCSARPTGSLDFG